MEDARCRHQGAPDLRAGPSADEKELGVDHFIQRQHDYNTPKQG